MRLRLFRPLHFGRLLAAFPCLRAVRRFAANAALIAAFGLVASASAQQAQKPPVQQVQPDGSKLDQLKQRDDELKALRDAQEKAKEAEAALRREIDEIGADRRKLNETLIG